MTISPIGIKNCIIFQKVPTTMCLVSKVVDAYIPKFYVRVLMRSWAPSTEG